jgi:novel protein kinase C epsilon type
MKCLDLVDLGCRQKSARSGSSSSQSHQLVPHKTVCRPTMCDHCGVYIIALCKYSECSKCSRNFHSECIKFFTDVCRPRLKGAMESAQTRVEKQPAKSASRMTIDDFDVLGLLGTGSFSKVFLAQRKTTGGNGGELYAIKVIKKTNPVVNGDPESAFNEWKSLQLGRKYPFLTFAHCCFQSRDRLYFVMEYVQGKDLLYYVNEQGAFPEERVRFHSAEIVLALIFMHKNNIIYRDLKLNNVILDQSGRCKLIDFGMSKQLQAHHQMKTSTFCGTIFYLSPEILKENSYDYSVDWWSLGVMMYEMLCDGLPFNGRTDAEVFKAIMTKDLTYPANVKLSDRAKSILEGLLTKEPNNRLGCVLLEGCSNAIKEHPFFLNEATGNSWWEDIELMKIEPPYRPSLASREPVLQSSNINQTPIDTKQLEELRQSCFDSFSQYSESFSNE